MFGQFVARFLLPNLWIPAQVRRCPPGPKIQSTVFPIIFEWLNFHRFIQHQHESTKVLTTEWIVGERLETSSAEAMGFPKNDVAAVNVTL